MAPNILEIKLYNSSSVSVFPQIHGIAHTAQTFLAHIHNRYMELLMEANAVQYQLDGSSVYMFMML